MSDRRGTYRGIYSALLDTLEFQSLSSIARHTFLTMRLCSQNNAASIFRLYEGTLAEQTGYSAPEIRSALQELATGEEPWIEYNNGLVWIKNGLRYDPSMRLSDKKHLVAVHRAISALPRCELVLKFCEYYKIARPFDGPVRTYTHSGTPSPIPRSDSESDSESDTDTDKSIVGQAPPRKARDNGLLGEAKEVLAWLNEKTGKNFRPVDVNLSMIVARLRSGILPGQLKAIITRKVREWATDEDKAKYLRPATLFGRMKCEQYLGELPRMEDPNAGVS